MEILYFETNNLSHITSLAMLLKFDKINFHGAVNDDGSYLKDYYQDILDNPLISEEVKENNMKSSHFIDNYTIYLQDEYLYLAEDEHALNNIYESFEKEEYSKKNNDDFLKSLIYFLFENLENIRHAKLNFYYLAAIYVHNNELYLDIFTGAIFEDNHILILENYFLNTYNEKPIFLHSATYYNENYKKIDLIDLTTYSFKNEILYTFFYDYNFLTLLKNEDYYNMTKRILSIELTHFLKDIKINQNNPGFINPRHLIYNVIHYCMDKGFSPNTNNQKIFLPIRDVYLLGGVIDE